MRRFFGNVLKESSFERRCAVVVFAVANLGLFFDPIETSHVNIHTIQRQVCILCLIAVHCCSRVALVCTLLRSSSRVLPHASYLGLWCGSSICCRLGA